jgi:hypothetical protein
MHHEIMVIYLVTDKIPSAKVQKRMAENKLEPIGDYLMAWNHVSA